MLFQVFGPEDTSKLFAYLGDMEPPYCVTVQKGRKRTLDQNALLHKWFGEIAKHYGDRTALDVKGECHRQWGLTIRLRDEPFAWVWARTGAGLGYEAQCRMLASGILGVSSKMTVTELSEYMDGMSTHYLSEGVRLTLPEPL